MSVCLMPASWQGPDTWPVACGPLEAPHGDGQFWWSADLNPDNFTDRGCRPGSPGSRGEGNKSQSAGMRRVGHAGGPAMVVRSRVRPDEEDLPPARPPPQRVLCHKVLGTGCTVFIAQAHSAVTAVRGPGAGFTGPCLPKGAWKETVGRGCQLRCHPVTSCVLPAREGHPGLAGGGPGASVSPAANKRTSPSGHTRPAGPLGLGQASAPAQAERTQEGVGAQGHSPGWGKLAHGPLLSPSRLQPQHFAGLRSAESCS